MGATAVVFAYHDVGVRCLSVLLAHDVDVRLVVTHRDDPQEPAWFASVEREALARGLRVALPEDPGAAPFVETMRVIRPDFIFSFYYRCMLPPPLLACARRGAYNLHGSLLPRYRGRAPVNWAVLKGERETGATLHVMTEKPDAGAIVDQEAVPIGDDDLAVDVFRKVTDAASLVLDRALPGLLAGTASTRAQDLSLGSYFGRRRPEDGCIDWSRSAREIHDLVRAVAPPYPGAFTTWEGATVRILRSRRASGPAQLPAHALPGTIASEGERSFARCGDGNWIEILQAEIDPPQVLEGKALASRLGALATRMGQSPA